ncbi:MAG: hybrid sensor histidine kinase/response regulator [Fibrobacterales bacterium]
MVAGNKILIVDDDPMNVGIFEEILEGSYELAIAMNGSEAIEMMPQFEPDLVLLDIMMPGIDGYEVCKTIRKNPTYAFTKIILVSGKSMIDERLHGYEVGADDYITKPFIDEELAAKVKVFIKLKRTEEVEAIKGDLLKLFSHETRTPLNGIIGIGNLLVDEKEIPEAHRSNIRLMVECGYQLLEFVEKTKLICSIKSERIIERSSILLHSRVDQVVEEFKPTAEAKDVVLINNAMEPVVLDADWSYLKKVLGYLLHNAIKFSPAGGAVEVGITDVDDVVTLSVADGGIGVAHKDRAAIFDEFSISDIMHHNKGQGLSLAISKYVMEAHGGNIDVEENDGGGARFLLTFPRCTSNVSSQNAC